MSVEDCGNVELPPWSYSVPSLNSEQEDPSDPASKIASLLLAKLADYVVPGEQLLDRRVALRCPLPGDSQTHKRDKGEGTEGERGRRGVQSQFFSCPNNMAAFLFA